MICAPRLQGSPAAGLRAIDARPKRTAPANSLADRYSRQICGNAGSQNSRFCKENQCRSRRHWRRRAVPRQAAGGARKLTQISSGVALRCRTPYRLHHFTKCYAAADGRPGCWGLGRAPLRVRPRPFSAIITRPGGLARTPVVAALLQTGYRSGRCQDSGSRPGSPTAMTPTGLSGAHVTDDVGLRPTCRLVPRSLTAPRPRASRKPTRGCRPSRRRRLRQV